MSCFDFKITYQSDKQDQKSDVLTQQIQDLSANFSDEQIVNQLWILLSSEQFEKIWFMFTHNDEFDDINLNKNIDKWDMNFENLLKHEYEHNLWISEIINVIKNDQWQHKNIIFAECEIQNDQFYYKQKMIISNSDILQYKILEFAHNSTVISHSDQAKIYEIVQWAYYWSEMHDFVQWYVQECQTCIWEKVSHRQKQEVL